MTTQHCCVVFELRTGCYIMGVVGTLTTGLLTILAGLNFLQMATNPGLRHIHLWVLGSFFEKDLANYPLGIVIGFGVLTLLMFTLCINHLVLWLSVNKSRPTLLHIHIIIEWCLFIVMILFFGNYIILTYSNQEVRTTYFLIILIFIAGVDVYCLMRKEALRRLQLKELTGDRREVLQLSHEGLTIRLVAKTSSAGPIIALQQKLPSSSQDLSHPRKPGKHPNKDPRTKDTPRSSWFHDYH